MSTSLHRRLAVGGGTLASILAIAGTPAAAVAPDAPASPLPTPMACTASLLPTPADHHSYVTTADPSGRYILGYLTPHGGTVGQEGYWDNGVWTPLTTSVPRASFSDVNGRGVVVGGGTATDGRRHALIHHAGVSTILPNVRASDYSYALSVNERGDVVGFARDTTPGGGSPFRFIVWPAADLNRPVELATVPIPILHNPSGYVVIDDDGTIVAATAEYLSTRSYVHLWRPDGWQGVGALQPGLYWPHRSLSLRGGFVTNVQTGPSANPLRWNTRTGELTPLPAGIFEKSEVNSTGQVAAAWSDDTTRHAALVRDLAVVKLPRVGSDTAVSVSDSGIQVVGDTRIGSGSRAVVWRGC